jgi:hypothetical protein
MPCIEMENAKTRDRVILHYKLVHAGTACNYDCDGLGSLHATAQSKSSYLKILKVQDRKIKSRYFFSRIDLENLRPTHA